MDNEKDIVAENRQAQRNAAKRYLENRSSAPSTTQREIGRGSVDPKDRWWFVVLKEPHIGPTAVKYELHNENPKTAKSSVGVRLYSDEQIADSYQLTPDSYALGLEALIRLYKQDREGRI